MVLSVVAISANVYELRFYNIAYVPLHSLIMSLAHTPLIVTTTKRRRSKLSQLLYIHHTCFRHIATVFLCKIGCVCDPR